MGWGELAGGVMGAIGSIAGSAMSSSSAKANTQAQINWERERAKNAHQWEVEDLKKAGLNPILSAGGSGANTGGISPQMPDTSGISSAGQYLQKGIDQIITQKQTESNVELQSAQKSLTNAQEANEVEKNPNIQKKDKAEIAKLKAEKTKLDLENELNQKVLEMRVNREQAQMIKEIAEGKISANNAEVLRKLGITREEAVKLGSDGLKMIFSMLNAKIGGKAIEKASSNLKKRKEPKLNSAKKISNN